VEAAERQDTRADRSRLKLYSIPGGRVFLLFVSNLKEKDETAGC
jgi:hypothetical protein